ncbi:cytokinin-o-glucosyltransferase 2 [Hordeum vulgare]|nr:cytokinin-o-glucosyltransferase 2 [Hordeum vulgare]
MAGVREPDAVGMTRKADDRSTASILGHGNEWDDPVDMLNHNKVIFFKRDTVKKVFNISSGNKTVELYKRDEKCDLRNICHKNGRAPIAYTMDVLHKARSDDGDTTKRSWVLLMLATVFTLGTGNMVPLKCMKSLEEMDKVTEFTWDEHVLSVAMNEFRPPSETSCATWYPEGPVTCVAVGNITGAAQDVDCDDTQDRMDENVNINENQDNVGVKDNRVEDSNPTENGKVQKNMRMGQLLKYVHFASSSNQQATDVTFDIPHRNNDVHKPGDHGGSKKSSSGKFADERTTGNVVIEPVEGAERNHASNSAHEPNVGNVVELRVGTSVGDNEANANSYENENEQVLSGEDVEHGPQLSHLDHSALTSVGGHWSDAPSMSVFQEGIEEYNWWIGVPNTDADSNASSHGNTTTTQKSCVVFDAIPQAPDSTGIKVLVYDATPISIAPFSCGNADGSPKPQEEPFVLVSGREPSPNRDEEKLGLKDKKKVKSEKRIKTYLKIKAMY